MAYTSYAELQGKLQLYTYQVLDALMGGDSDDTDGTNAPKLSLGELNRHVSTALGTSVSQFAVNVLVGSLATGGLVTKTDDKKYYLTYEQFETALQWLENAPEGWGKAILRKQEETLTDAPKVPRDFTHPVTKSGWSGEKPYLAAYKTGQWQRGYAPDNWQILFVSPKGNIYRSTDDGRLQRHPGTIDEDLWQNVKPRKEN